MENKYIKSTKVLFDSRFSLRRVAVAFTLLIIGTSLFATNYTAKSEGGLWSSSSTWVGGEAPGNTIYANDEVEINGTAVIYDLQSDLKVYGTLNITNEASLQFPETPGEPGQGKSIQMESDAAVVNVIGSDLIMPVFLSDGSNNNGNFDHKNGVFTSMNSYMEVGQNWGSSYDGSGPEPTRIIINSCLLVGENFDNSGGIDTLIGVCMQLGLHGSGNFVNSSNALRYVESTSILLMGSGNVSNSSGSILSGGLFSRLFISDGNLDNSGEWTANILSYCVNGGSINSIPSGMLGGPEDCSSLDEPAELECGFCGPTGELPPPLAVALSYFTAEKSGDASFLKWTSVSEVNSHHYEIQRAGSDGIYTSIGEVKAAGTSTTSNTYKFEDRSPLAGINYYRLKLIDNDGKFTMSPIRSTSFSTAGQITFYPNPVVDIIHFDLYGDDSRETNISVLDFNGRQVAIHKASGTSADINVSNLPSGKYLVKITTNAGIETYWFIKS